MMNADELTPWSAASSIGPRLGGGNRNVVHEAVVDGERVVARRSARSALSLEWELDLLDALAGHGFTVPTAIPTAGGARHVDGVVVSRWVDGRPPADDDDWRAVAAELTRLHGLTRGWPQRPGSRRARELLIDTVGGDVDLRAMPAPAVDAVRAAWARLPDGDEVVVHGDPNVNNVRILDDGRVALFDWDEARVDCAWFDLADLPVRCLEPAAAVVARTASHAWEAANGWRIEPCYAHWRLGLLSSR